MQKQTFYEDSKGNLIPPYAALLKQQAQAIPDHIFLLIDREHITYRELYDRALNISAGMRKLGMGPGDRIGILMPNCLDFFIAFFAIQILGAIVVPINARFKIHELSYVLNHADIKMLFTTDRIDEHVNFVELIWQTLTQLEHTKRAPRLEVQAAPELQQIVVFADTTKYPAYAIDEVENMGLQLAKNEATELAVTVCVDDIAVMLYTSGTTAMPKACQLTHRGFYHSWITGYADAVALTEAERVWNPLPFFHIGGIGPMTAVLARGATMLSSIHYDPAAALAQVREHQPQHLYPGFFTLLLPLLREPDYDKNALSEARSAIMVAPYETQLLIRELLPPGVKVLQIFAMTEASGYVTLTSPDASEQHRLQTNGTALPDVEVRIVDPESELVLSPGNAGEIQFRGPVAFHSYYADAATTRATILEGGWIKSGDYGRMDKDGTTYFLGRIKDMLKVGGENVAAAEIEAYLSTHPAVKLSQVVARADAHLDEVPVAFVELLPNHTVSRDELVDFCSGKLASFKIPRDIIFVTEWPMSATKIQKFRLRELLTNNSES